MGKCRRKFRVAKYLRKKYHVPVLIRNNTNTAAYGFYASHPEYKIIALNDPDIILIRCKLLPDTEILKMRLISYIPEKYLPKMKKISDEESADYMLLGMLMICVEDADKK